MGALEGWGEGGGSKHHNAVEKNLPQRKNHDKTQTPRTSQVCDSPFWKVFWAPLPQCSFIKEAPHYTIQRMEHVINLWMRTYYVLPNIIEISAYFFQVKAPKLRSFFVMSKLQRFCKNWHMKTLSVKLISSMLVSSAIWYNSVTYSTQMVAITTVAKWHAITAKKQMNFLVN